jgi:simple sugar transport system ATP-binding protein
VAVLFATLRKLAAEGTAILYISHKLEEIRALCDAATILRRGQVVAVADPKSTSARQLAELMVGTSLATPARRDHALGDIALHVKGLSLPSPSAFGTALHDVSLAVRKGEILGIAGVAGNGQDELLLALSGELTAPQGKVTIGGQDAGPLGPVARRALGLVAAPEERLGHAAAPDMTLVENALLSGAARKGLVRRGFIDWPGATAFADSIVAAFDVRTPGTQATARSLSGGNLQKFVVGRELMQDPSVIVVNQPTWGVDAAAAAAIRQAILDRAAAGAAVVVISQDLDELIEIATRIAALNAGRLSEARPVEGLTLDAIGLMMGGADLSPTAAMA